MKSILRSVAFGGKTALLLVLLVFLAARTPAQITVTTVTAPVNTLTINDLDYLNSTTPKWLFTITMISPRTVQAVMTINLDVMLANGERYINAAQFISEPFTIDRTRTVTNLELGRGRGIPQQTYIFNNEAKAKFLEIALPSGSMPAGSYLFTVNVREVNGPDSDTEHFTFVLTNPSTPVLLAPQDGEVLTEEFPLFEWQYDGPRATIAIFEKLPGQGSLEETASGTPHHTATIETRSFRYPTNARTLQPGQTYVWYVTGLVGAAGGTNIEQRSALRSFTMATTRTSSLAWLLQDLERALPAAYKPVFDQIRAQNLSPTGTYRLNGSPISLTELLRVLNEIRANPESVGSVDLQ
ncbi:MAG: hypothetical protein C4326_01705 [Ignavibacteria bacterium]